MSDISINKKELKHNQSIFIGGELVDLCVLNEINAKVNRWVHNDKNLEGTENRILSNCNFDMIQFLKSLPEDKTKIVLLVYNKISNEAIGLVSLKDINFQKKSAEIVVEFKTVKTNFLVYYQFLEAIALITQHGFDQVGLNRIYCTLSYPFLNLWNRLLELIGFVPEGIIRNTLLKTEVIQQTLISACQYEIFLKIKEKRGSLWGSSKHIKKIEKKLSKISFADLLNEEYIALEKEYFKFVY